MEIKKPIFILNPARSGSTIFYNLFTRHKDTAFPEHYIDKYWKSPIMINFIPMLVKIQQWRYKQRSLPHAGIFWRKFHPYSSYLDENLITEKEKNYIYSAIRAELKAFKAKRFVDRAHDFMLQIRFLNKLFPDAFYIILNREPKAVVNSQYTLMKNEWRPDRNKDTLGNVIAKFGKADSPLESCINYYKYYISTMQKDLKIVEKTSIEVRYEEFVKDPRSELKNIYQFTELEWYSDLENEIPKILELKNNQKWLQLPENEKNILQNAFSSVDY